MAGGCGQVAVGTWTKDEVGSKNHAACSDLQISGHGAIDESSASGGDSELLVSAVQRNAAVEGEITRHIGRQTFTAVGPVNGSRASIDETVMSADDSAEFDGSPGDYVWARDGKALLFSAEEKAASPIFSASVADAIRIPGRSLPSNVSARSIAPAARMVRRATMRHKRWRG